MNKQEQDKQNADRFYKNADGTPDYTREVPTGIPSSVSLHEAALTRPHTVEKIISDGGEKARAASFEKSAIDEARALTTIIPDGTKGQDALEDVDVSALTNSADEIQPVTDINPAAHTTDAQTGTETLDGDSVKATEDAAKAKSEQDGKQPLKVELVGDKSAAASKTTSNAGSKKK